METKKEKGMYRKLFTSTFYLSAFTVGGGYVIVPLMKKKFVEELQWIDEEEMLNLTAIAQAAPGAIAVNASLLVGFRVAGPAGAFFTLLGTLLPPLIILVVISLFYDAFRSNAVVAAVLKGMQAGVAAVIADAVVKMGAGIYKEKRLMSYLIMAGAFVANSFFRVSLVWIILFCGALGALVYCMEKRTRSKG